MAVFPGDVLVGDAEGVVVIPRHLADEVARDGAGNLGTSASVPVTVTNTGSPGLVGAWAFDEGSGTAIADQSGKGNNGTVANATPKRLPARSGMTEASPSRAARRCGPENTRHWPGSAVPHATG